MKTENNKTLFCESCGNYPDEILESCFVERARKWNGSEYELVAERTDEENVIPFCGKCNTQLTEKTDVESMPEV